MDVLKAFDIGQICMPKTAHTSQTYEDPLTTIVDKGLSITEAKAGKVLFDLDDLHAALIGPGRIYDDLNDMSTVLSLRYGDKTFLFMGDASTKAESAMLISSAVPLPDSDVLKVGHHGSSASTGTYFLNAVTPSIAVISVGYGKAYGHPAQT